MKLKWLNLHAFGRFQEQEIVLADGLNLICGENETGKSTIHRFIRGMLFGFKREGTARRYPTPELEQYRPWHGRDYRGSLVYVNEGGREILIQRSFDPDETGISDAVTGRSLENEFTMDSRKEYLFAQEHLGLNATVFDNTIFLAQLGGKTGKELAREVAGRLTHLSGSGREDLSVQQAMAELKKKRDDIGSVRAASRPLGKTVRILETLEQEETETAARYQSLRQQQEEKAQLEQERADLQAHHADLMEKLERIQRFKLHRDGQKVLELWHKREAAAVYVQENQEAAHFPEYLREELAEIMTRLDSLGDTIAGVRQREEETEQLAERIRKDSAGFPLNVAYHSEARRELTARMARLDTGQERLDEQREMLTSMCWERESIQEKYQPQAHLESLADRIPQLEREDEEIRTLQMSTLPEQIRAADREKRGILQYIRRSIYSTAAATGVGLVSAVWAYQADWVGAAAVLAGAVLAVSLGAGLLVQRGRSRLTKIQEHQSRRTEEYREEQSRLDGLRENRQTVLAAAGAEDLPDVRRRLDRFMQDQEQLRQLAEKIRALKDDMAVRRARWDDLAESVRASIEPIVPDAVDMELSEALLQVCLERMEEQQQRQDELKQAQKSRVLLTRERMELAQQETRLVRRRDEILQKAEAADWEAFLAGCRRREQFCRAEEHREHVDALLERFLSKRSIEQWRNELKQKPLTAADREGSDGDLETVNTQLEEATHRIQQIDIRLAAVAADMVRALEGHRELVEIQEEQTAVQRERENLEMEAGALNIALEALEAAGEKRHRLLAPELNRRVGDIIQHLTLDRYRRVRIDEQLTVTVSTPHGGRQVDLSALSAGTVDQFYFAVRVAMADLISQGRKLTLFLDDPFMQYSPRRLRKVLEYVGELAQERQILLFTCRDQEQFLLDTLSIPYHRICLDDVPKNQE